MTAPTAIDFLIGEKPIRDTFTTGLTDVRVNYAVSGSGSVYVKIGDRRLNGGRSLTTSSAAPVYLNMNGSTNRVTASIVGQRAELAQSVTYIYPPAVLTKESGDKQKGARSSRLASPLIVKVIDGKNRGVSGVQINFNAEGGGAFRRDSNFPSNLYVPGTGDSTGVKTNSSGVANIFWVLGSEADPPQTATANLAGSTAIQANAPIFTATFGTTTSTANSIVIESGDGQRADKFGLLEDPLVVVVRDQRGQRMNRERVTFLARDGGTLDAPAGDDPGTLPTEGNTVSPSTIIDVMTNPSGEASIRYTPPENGGRRTVGASIRGGLKSVVFTVNGSPVPTTPATPATPATPNGSLNITVSGEGATRTVSVAAISAQGTPVSILSTLTGTALTSTQVVTTGTETTITVPTTPGSYTLTATAGVAGYTPDTETITVAGPTSLGTVSITQIGSPNNGVQTFSIAVVDTNGNRISGALTVTVSGAGFTTSSVPTASGSGAVNMTLPTTAGSYTLTASAQGYESGTAPVRIAGTTPTTPTPTPTPTTPTPTTVGVPDSISIVGPSQRSGTANTALDAALIVQVVDDDGDAVADARVIFRVRTGQGRLSQRGSGRAIAVQTDAQGYGRATYTPISASSTVEAEARGVTRRVTFTITASGGTTTPRDTGTSTTPSTTISPVVHVGAAQRPPMLWVDGGAIYALVGASPQRFASGVDNALNIAVGGGKVYWTEKTGDSAGTINSANLNGSNVQELASILAVPMGIAVDAANSKLYWTNSRGRIQTADLDGSGITNVIPSGLEGVMDIALAGGNAYWTQGGNVRFVNLRGQKQIRNISTGTDTAGSLAIGGGKVYWTEMTGESGGTVNSANLNGTGARQLASILATPMGIAVDGSRSKLYWGNARGRIQSSNLNGSKIQNVVSGLGSPGDMVLSNSISAPTTTTPTTTTTTASNKYDVNGDGSVDSKDVDALIVAVAAGVTDAKYDVTGDGKVDIFDVSAVSSNRSDGAAAAPALLGTQLSIVQIDRLQEQIDLLIASNDRSPDALRILTYLQQLIVMARPEKTQLLANYPNPFNPETWIPYELATDTDVRITIYNTQGVVIRTLALGHQAAGYYTGRDRAAYWDGRNALGEQVASGIYFYQFETDEMSSMRKMVILK